MESIKPYPANIYYNHNRSTTTEDMPTVTTKDYVFIGMTLSLVVFLVTALILTILSMTLLYRWIPEILLIILMLGGSIAAGFGTLKYFLDLDTKQWSNK